MYLVTYKLNEVNEIMSRAPSSTKYGNASMSNDRSFSGGSYDDAKTLAEHGDTPTYEQLTQEARKLTSKVNVGGDIMGRKKQPDVIGDVHMGRYLDDDPKCCNRRRRGIIPNKLVKILCNVSATSSVDTSTIVARGTAIYVLIRALELKGYSVELLLTCPSYESIIDIVLKEYGQYANPTVIAFYLTSPLVLRRILFRLMEEPDDNTRYNLGAIEGCGYGKVVDHPNISDKTVYFGCLKFNNSDSSYWYKYGKEQLAKYGVVIK